MTSSAKFLTNRVEELKQHVILDKCDSLDFDNYSDLYSRVIDSFSNGELDNVYSSPFLSSLDREERSRVLSTCRNYFDLCFPYGKVEEWRVNIDPIFSENLDLYLITLFSNFDVLLEVMKYGGESSLNFLRRLYKYELYSDMSAVDYFKSKISDIDTLKQVLIELGQDDNLFSKMSLKQKVVLATYPKGNLYEEHSDGTSNMISPNTLGLKIVKRHDDTVDEENFDFKRFLSLASDYDFFVDSVTNNYLESCFGNSFDIFDVSKK